MKNTSILFVLLFWMVRIYYLNVRIWEVHTRLLVVYRILQYLIWIIYCLHLRQYVNSERKRKFSKELRVEENRMQNVHQKLKSREISRYYWNWFSLTDKYSNLAFLRVNYQTKSYFFIRVAEDLRLEGTRLRQMLFELEFDKYTRQLLEYRRDVRIRLFVLLYFIP